MSPDLTDEALLRQYVTHESEAAFAQLVQRHHGLVYKTCRRELGDADLAEDATQAVFLILARKAQSLRASSSLTGWLFQTARFAAKNLGKQERRRRQRESQAAESAQGASPQAGDLWERLEPSLNDALARLGQGEREAVLMRFFEGQSLAEVGAALGVSENAARMRVTRAIDRIRRLLARKGVPLTPAALAALLAEKAGEAARVALPAGTALSHSLAKASAQQLAQGVLRAMWMKTVLTTAAVSAVTGAAITAPLVAPARGTVSRNTSAQAPRTRAVGAAPATAVHVDSAPFSPVDAWQLAHPVTDRVVVVPGRLTAVPDGAAPVSTPATTSSPTTGPIIRKIMFTANTPDGRPSVPYSALEWAMDSKVGQAYDSDTVMRDLNRLFNRQTGFVRSMGFLADVSSDVKFDPGTGVLTIPIVEAHISKIIITGNQKTPTSDILAQLQAKPGDVLDENAIPKDVTHIYDMDLFSQVGPFQEQPTDRVGEVNVTVPVVEK